MNFRAENNEWHHGFQMTFANGCTISVQFSKDSYRDWETDRKSTRLNSSHITRSRMPSSA